jgi:hypothetical protein
MIDETGGDAVLMNTVGAIWHSPAKWKRFPLVASGRANLVRA